MRERERNKIECLELMLPKIFFNILALSVHRKAFQEKVKLTDILFIIELSHSRFIPAEQKMPRLRLEPGHHGNIISLYSLWTFIVTLFVNYYDEYFVIFRMFFKQRYILFVIFRSFM